VRAVILAIDRRRLRSFPNAIALQIPHFELRYYSSDM
jgi:hypothetical protein